MAHPDIALPGGCRLAFHDTLDSTNADALRRAAKGEDGGLWVMAGSQEAGRGRLGRRWTSRRGNLFASLLLRPNCAPAAATQAGFVGGVAVHDTVTGLAAGRPAADVSLKWPNDLLVDGRKAGGILLEGAASPSGVPTIVMGVGLNLASHPADTDYPATHLKEHGIAAAPKAALERLAQACDTWLAVWNDGAGFGEIRQAWLARAQPLGTPLRVRLQDGTLEGVFSGVADDGALILTLAGGDERRITAGDVFHL